jgi:hypothetical protein
MNKYERDQLIYKIMIGTLIVLVIGFIIYVNVFGEWLSNLYLV